MEKLNEADALIVRSPVYYGQPSMRCNLTQREVAEQSGIRLTTIHKFENGTAGNLSLFTFILLLKVVGQINALDDLLPELPESPYLVRKDDKKAQRIRHSK